jgi:hypothetical protein
MSKGKNNVVTLSTDGQTAGEFLSDLHAAICQILMMIFERREVDLGEEAAYAVYFLLKLQSKIVK